MLTPDFFFRQKSEKQPPRRRETFKKPATRNFRFWLPEVAARRGRSVWVPNFLYVSAIECIGGGQRNPTERRLYRGRTPPTPKTRKTAEEGGSRSFFFTFFHFFCVLEHRPRVPPHGFVSKPCKDSLFRVFRRMFSCVRFSCFECISLCCSDFFFFYFFMDGLAQILNRSFGAGRMSPSLQAQSAPGGPKT